MKHVYLLIPEGLTFDQLADKQQDAIAGIFGQYVMPMPESMAVDGLVICDAICSDAFDPALMGPLGLDWEVIGMEQWDGDDTSVLIPMDEAKYTERLAPVMVVNDAGKVLSENPRGFVQVHIYAGWPDSLLFGGNP